MSDQLVGPYRVLEKLGAGGMGEVYLAEDTRLGRKVALKRPSDALLGQPDARQQLHREARAAAALTHPNLAAVHDVLDDASGSYIVMEYVEGESLAKAIEGGPLPAPRAVMIAIQMAQGLAAAHARNIVHRDLKPGNVCLTPDGQAKILDFGLAGIGQSHADGTRSHLTLPRSFAGTPGYASPEQLSGARPHPSDDIYSLGMVLFELLAGRRPFTETEPMAAALATMTRTPPTVRQFNPSVPPDLSAAVARAIARDRRDRYATVDEFRAELERIAGSWSQLPTGEVAVRPPRPRRAAALVLAAALLGAPAAWLLLTRSWGETPVEAAAPVLAVLPFDSAGDDLSIASGFRDVLIANLSSVAGLNVLSRAATAESTRDRRDSRFARDIGATFLVEGSLQRSGSALQITVHLVRADSGTSVWGNVYSGTEDDLFGLQQRIADDLAAASPLPGGAGGRRRRMEAGTRDVQALSHYGQAAAFLERPDIPGNVQRAVQLLETAVERDPDFALAWARLGDAYWAHYEETQQPEWTDKAKAAIASALDVDPDQPRVRISLARIYAGTGRAEVAIAELGKALELEPRNDEGHRLLGQVLQSAGRTDEAAVEYHRAIDARPDYWRNHIALGNLHFATGRHDEALQAYTRVTELQPDNARGYHNLGTVHYVMGDHDRALAFYRQAIQISPMPQTWSNMGNIYYDRGDYGAAADAFRQAIAGKPNDGLLYGNLGDAYARLTQTGEAREAYERAAELERQLLRVNPNEAAALGRLAVFLAKLGHAAEAEQHVSRALTLRANDGELHYRAAVVRAIAGNTGQALQDLEAALTHGYSAAIARRDHDLASIRDTPAFRKLTSGR